MIKNTKSRNVCFDCQNNKNTKLNNYPNSNLEMKIEELIKSVSFMSLKFDTFENKLETISKEIKFIQKENEQNKLENKRLTNEVSEIKYKLEQIDHTILGISIEVTGIPKTEKENCLEIIKKIGEINNVQLNVLEAKRITLDKPKLNIIIAKIENKDMRL